MKKNLLAIMVMFASSWILLLACNSNPAQDQALQAPSLPPADTSAATITTEKETDEDDDDGAVQTTIPSKQAANSANNATLNNLLTAYAGESTASAKYAAYAKKAQEEGLTQIALLFKATSTSEKIHANNHRSVIEDMGGNVSDIKPVYTVKTTRENLADAIAGEAYEIATMYPEFMSVANAADNQPALTTFNYAFRTEQRHKSFYEKALAGMQSGQLGALSVQYYVCPTCGNTYDTAPPKRCRVSMTNCERFVKINTV